MDKIVLINYANHEFQDLIKNSLQEAINDLNLFSKPTPEKEKQILTRKETAALLCISLPTLHSYSMNGKIKSFRFGNLIRYRLQDVYESLSQINLSRK